ncbi:biopolymer transporter ExbD [Marinobacter sp. M3C]|uniref:ExbD/TolR family protein n=1 Tax=Marinobacter sp. M3C TaxID=2917715 RepID=UPI002010024B|nr:biopolymer transporter ExbD [Marinobacter sp. M3C]UQG60643.1 biopolymer transporter ExbD [Marinobacter sp. M3C]
MPPMQLVEPRPARPLPIRLTPLIDVVFILLVFFMLTTRLLPVEHLLLDNATTPTGSATGGESISEMTLYGDGTLGWRGQRLPIPAMVRKFTENGTGEVNLKAIGEASLANFTTSLSALKSVGIDVHWMRATASSNREGQ